MRLLGLDKGGKAVADMLQVVLEWQLENPDGRQEDLENWLRAEWRKKEHETERAKRQKDE
jgi:hypothetical protein